MTRFRFALLLVLLLPALAYADAVDPEPESCPPGSRPSTAHTGPYCAPVPDCAGEGDRSCPIGTACTSVMQCIETRACGGLAPPDAEPCTIEHVVGPCGEGGSCATGTCRARDVCVGESTGGGDDGGCGCSAAGASRSFAFAPVLALAFALLLFRRRSPSARAPRR